MQDGKADGKTALKPGNFGIHRLHKETRLCKGRYFSLASRKEPEKSCVYQSRLPFSLDHCIIGIFSRKGVCMFRFFACFTVVIILLGCSVDDEGERTLHGTWINVYPGQDGEDYITTIEINTSTQTITYTDSYEGVIVNSPDFTARNGVLIIRFTTYWDMDWSELPDITYTENLHNVGKYGGLYWRELGPQSVSMADYWEHETVGETFNSNHIMFDDIDEARVFFTMVRGAEMDWAGFSVYTK